jgi:aminomuconate-semialdehyde/2-hydroxymuconate-6-semialdehyde dehydrogenase
MLEIKNYINGSFVRARSGSVFPSMEPAVGHPWATLPDSDADDVNDAVQAAKRAFPAWAATPMEERSTIMLRLADLLHQHTADLARTESQDTGKPVALARRMDIPRAAANFRFFATALLHHSSATYQSDAEALNYTLRQPLGVVGCISPWNLPLYLFTWKIAPAIATGNTVVAKPSELAPATAFRLGELAVQAGLPAGVLNIVHGLGATTGQAIVEHPDVKAISFTGGTNTGARIAAAAAPMFKKLSLELGGKNPALVFADCDYENTLSTLVRASFTNQGQICLCSSRILVERSLYDRFRDDFVARVQALKVGDPNDEVNTQGAVISAGHRDKVLAYIELAKEEGGTVLCGGSSVKPTGRCSSGYFVHPTVIEGLPQTCRTNQEEIFGPVVTLQPFDDENEALQLANSVRFGLSATIWTTHLQRAHRLANGLQAGVVWVNCWLLRDLRTPFGGMKDSGVGREGGWDALNFFTEQKNICLKL